MTIESMDDLQVMVVGAGALGRHHARILAGLPGVKLAVVADPRQESGEAIATQYGARWVADYKEAIDDVDAASIVVPTSLHARVAREFLLRGMPVLVEKPLTANIAQAQELVRLARSRDTVLQVGHVERFNPSMIAAKKVCGPPRYLRCERLSPYPFRSTDIGVVHDLLIHDVDLVLDLVRSPLANVQAMGIKVISHHEDIVNARLTFENGCVADLTASRCNPFVRREMQIWSAINCVTVDFQTRKVMSYAPGEELRYGRSPLELAAEPGADIDQLKQDVFGRFIDVGQVAVSDADALTAELAEFAAAAKGQCRPACGGQEALDALHVAEAVLSAMREASSQSLSRAA